MQVKYLGRNGRLINQNGKQFKLMIDLHGTIILFFQVVTLFYNELKQNLD